MECIHKITGDELKDAINCDDEYEWIQVRYTCGDLEQMMLDEPDLCFELGEKPIFESECCSEFEYKTESNENVYSCYI